MAQMACEVNMKILVDGKEMEASHVDFAYEDADGNLFTRNR